MSEQKNTSLGLGDKLNMDHLSSGKKKWGRRIWMLIGLIALGLILWAVFFGGSKANKYEFTKVVKKDVREAVEITGNVEAGATINLTFRQNGQVDKINFDVGDKVKKGDIIAEINNRDEELRLKQAKANLSGANANLNQKIAGSTNEEIRIAEANLQKTQAASEKVNIDFANAKEELELIKKKYEQDEKTAQLLVDDAKSKYEFAVKNKDNTGKTQDQSVETAKQDLEAQLYSTAAQIQQSLLTIKSIVIEDGNTVIPQQDINRIPFQVKNDATNLYNKVKPVFDPMYADLKSTTGYSADQLKVYAVQEQQMVTDLLQAQKILADGLSSLPPSSSFTQSQIDALKTKLNADSAAIAGSLSGLNLKYQNILTALLNVQTGGDSSDSNVASAKNFYDQQLQNFEQKKIDHQVDLNLREANIRSLQADYQIQLAAIAASKAELDLRKAGPRGVDLAYLRTQVLADQIAVSLAEEAFEKTLLRAPMDGVISRRNIELSEDALSSSSVASSGKGVFEMISADKYKINANIAEVDIGKLKVGDKAEITLDAVGDDKFEGTIVKIDPVETKIQDVVFYQAEVVIESKDARIKPGMTATVTIVLKQSLDALTLPEKAIQTEGGQKFVRILKEEMVQNIPVETGIRNLQGDTEILNGVSDGQEIILKTNGK